MISSLNPKEKLLKVKDSDVEFDKEYESYTKNKINSKI